jgi:hypothetical protein
MKYFMDTEFLEGSQKLRLFGWNTGLDDVNTIDLISIGIVSEDGREFYEVSKDFNLKEAWNRWQQRTGQGDRNNHEPKHYWIRENVLLPIFKEFLKLETEYLIKQRRMIGYAFPLDTQFTYRNFKRLLKKFGKTNKEISKKVIKFVYINEGFPVAKIEKRGDIIVLDLDKLKDKNIEFYAYYGAYDWVVFCWLFGKMIDLPKGFPMFFKDLKVMLDSAAVDYYNERFHYLEEPEKLDVSDYDKIIFVKNLNNYPTQDNCHNALDDAKWDLKLYKFIEELL